MAFGASFCPTLSASFLRSFLFDRFLNHLGSFGAPSGVHLALWGRPLAHFGLQTGALGASLGPFGGAQGVDLRGPGRLLAPKWSEHGAQNDPK